MIKWLKLNALYIAWATALGATAGSLFFSNILNFPPCVLCWYQRIFMYPLALILGVGILAKDTKVHLYVLPLAAIGWVIALYHNLLYYSLIPDSITPCTSGISCTTKFIQYLGFITIPFLSLAAFSCILLFTFWSKK